MGVIAINLISLTVSVEFCRFRTLQTDGNEFYTVQVISIFGAMFSDVLGRTIIDNKESDTIYEN